MKIESIRDIADAIRKTQRIGEEKDEPEGVRYIQLSDTIARRICLVLDRQCDLDDMPSEEEILKLQMDGHTFHCAMRILTGDGECECDLKGHIPGGLSKAMYTGVCTICLAPSGSHHDWCKMKQSSTGDASKNH